MLEIGSVLDGKYKILNEIGHGGMSVVYLALNERANKTWAVKEVRKDGGNDSEVVSQGLVAETEMLKKLSHPNLPSIIDVIDKSESFIIVMDYIEGRSLQTVINHNGPQDQERVVEWAKQLCDVLGYLHSRKPPIIYRDMKPANVMLRPDGQVALIDFGTAREYKAHSQGDTIWLGTRGYAAPEQFGGRGQTDARTDIYCLGATMYHLLTGYSPADTQFVIYPLGQLKPELAGSGIEKVVAKCCEPDPAKRYQSCAELMYALEHVHDEDDKTAAIRRRHWRTFMAGCIIAAVGLGGMIAFSSLRKNAVNQSYDSLIRQAQNSGTFEEASDYYTQAMRLKPGEADAYNEILDDTISSDGEEGETITSNEKQLLEKAIMTSAGDRSRANNLDYFEANNHKDFISFEFRRGMDYFIYCDGQKSAAYDVLNPVKDDQDLDERDRRIAGCLTLLSEVYKKSGGAKQSGLGALSDQLSIDYKALWEQMETLASDPAVTDEKTGNKLISSILYREIGTQVDLHPNDLRNAGVSEENMLQLLQAGSDYIAQLEQGNARADAPVSDAIITQVKTALDNGMKTWDARNKGAVRAENSGSASGSQDQSGGA